MSESSSRPRRSLVVVLLDAMLGLVTAVQTGNVPGTRGTSGRPRSRAGIVWLAVGVAAAVGGTAILVSAVLRTPDGLADLPPGGLAAAPAPSSGAASSNSARPSASSPSTTAAAALAPHSSAATSTKPGNRSSSAAGARVAATYAAAAGTGVLGYRATVTVDSLGPDAAQDWRLTITLPRSTLQIAAVNGATVDQDGKVWTFTPVDATRKITAGDSVVVAFDVRGATLVDAAPTACTINDAPCAGLPR